MTDCEPLTVTRRVRLARLFNAPRVSRSTFSHPGEQVAAVKSQIEPAEKLQLLMKADAQVNQARPPRSRA